MKDTRNYDFILKDTGASTAAATISLPRHRWYYYKEGFSPTLVEKAIEFADLTDKDIILDPFNGSGTTTLTASTKGHNSIGIEVNPFTCFLSKSKSESPPIIEIDKVKDILFSGAETATTSPLINFSTFSKREGLDKWLFNDEVLIAFEGAWKQSDKISCKSSQFLARLALISSAMKNCNAKRDGKCLRYRPTWKEKGFDKNTFLKTLTNKIDEIKEDLEQSPVIREPMILAGDSRSILAQRDSRIEFKLCITSPPYLNTFDYTDIYRPELFLGKFVKTPTDLYNLRLKTVRSHIQARWNSPLTSDFGAIYKDAISHVNSNVDKLMDKKIPLMIQAYFEDIYNVLRLLHVQAAANAQVWFVVSNSAYADREIPVDLIIGEIGTKAGWFLKEIDVLEHIKRRKTKHSPNISLLRESVIIFSKCPKLILSYARNY